MKIVYQHYEPDQGLDELQAKIYNEASGLPARADILMIVDRTVGAASPSRHFDGCRLSSWGCQPEQKGLSSTEKASRRGFVRPERRRAKEAYP